MIADALDAKVEAYAATMDRHNPLFVGAAEGRLTVEQVAYYLFNVRHLIRHTPIHLERARRRALAAGDPALAEHFAGKLIEEEGHDRWADADLARLRAELGTEADGRVSPALDRLLRFIERTIDHQPARYLSYILVAEYLIARRGPEWLRLVEERCGIPASMMTVIGKHAELDAEHSDEGLEVIEALVPDPAMREPMCETFDASLAIFEDFCADVCSVGAPAEARPCATSSSA
ncbi:MAG TPA: hypothetical protein RMH99_16675 [Sandaracinaceae bacterium LLY-WYZ-13_1]|nr:hypothetical protein [Sandaracinaceae bacterium LLY-WYZ-13_1]